MKKTLAIFFMFMFSLSLTACDNSDDLNAELPEDLKNINYEEDVLPLIKEDESKLKVRGSCNVIASASHCLDYIGTMWTENDARLNCQGAGTFSLDACPYPDYGGCQSTKGTISETIIWYYKEGGGGYDDESIVYARMACEANPASNWTMPDDLK